MSRDPNLDVFVGNLTFNTTDEQLREVFCVVGSVKNVRILMDKETQRPKGYAFVEYGNVDSVHAAVRLLNGTELNGRALRVSFASGTGPAGSTLGPGVTLGSLGLSASGFGIGGYETAEAAPRPMAGTISAAVQHLQLHEAWDLLDTLKRLNEEQRLRPVLEAHPQLVAATQELQKKLGLV